MQSGGESFRNLHGDECRSACDTSCSDHADTKHLIISVRDDDLKIRSFIALLSSQLKVLFIIFGKYVHLAENMLDAKFYIQNL